MSWAERHPLSAAACSASAAPLRALLFGGLSEPLHSPAVLDALDEEGRCALHYSAWNGLLETTEALLEAGASIDVQTADRRSTPLHFAAGMGHPAVVAALLNRGASTSARDTDKWTPLDLARQNLFGNSAAAAAIVQLLLEAEQQGQQPQPAAAAAGAVG
jgi:Krev interaction trapped protein 1